MNALGFKLDLAKPSWPLRESYVLDMRSLPVDISGDLWLLNEPTHPICLDWAGYKIRAKGTANAVRRYFSWLITAQSPNSVYNAFRFAQLLFETEAFKRSDHYSGYVPYEAFSEARASLGRENQWQLHHARKLYRWCVDQGFPQFSQDVLDQLDDLVIGGNSKGQAVRSRDPDKGPLDAQEAAALTSALRAARLLNVMPIDEQAMLWLAHSLGSNSAQFACLREEDFSEEIDENGQVIASFLNVPRHKKKEAQLRSSFRRRRLEPFVGAVIRDLIAHNQQAHPCVVGEIAARPLFRADAAQYGANHPLAEWTWHLTSKGILRLVKRAVKRLRVLSRKGAPLHITTRRFRYSLGSRMIDQGASQVQVADALDHSDLQHVGVYFEIHSNLVEHVDHAVAMALAPRAQAFAKLVEREADAVRGNIPGSRCYYGDREREIVEPVGTCGNHSFCNIAAAPLACYTCPMFQPWMDGPHDLVLDGLIRDREKRLELGLNPKMVAINDHIIVEVAGVIERIAAKRQERAHD